MKQAKKTLLTALITLSLVIISVFPAFASTEGYLVNESTGEIIHYDYDLE